MSYFIDVSYVNCDIQTNVPNILIIYIYIFMYNQNHLTFKIMCYTLRIL